MTNLICVNRRMGPLFLPTSEKRDQGNRRVISHCRSIGNNWWKFTDAIKKGVFLGEEMIKNWGFIRFWVEMNVDFKFCFKILISNPDSKYCIKILLLYPGGIVRVLSWTCQSRLWPFYKDNIPINRSVSV